VLLRLVLSGSWYGDTASLLYLNLIISHKISKEQVYIWIKLGEASAQCPCFIGFT
jgi:hypothetical protein